MIKRLIRIIRQYDFFFFQEKVVNIVSEGAANAKAAADSAADVINENLDTLKDAACKFLFVEFQNKIKLVFFKYLADTVKSAQKAAENAKATAGKKLDEAKKAGEELKKKASGSVEDL